MGLQKFPIKRSETIEVVVNNVNVSQFRFSDNELTLDNIRVYGVIVHTNTLGKSFSGKTMLSDAIMKKSFITLADKNEKALLKRIPVETLMQNTFPMLELDGLEIDVRKSFIELQDRTGVTADTCWVVTILFEPIK